MAASFNAAPGLHYEVARAMQAKRDPQLEAEILSWIGQVTKEKIPQAPFEDVLHDGSLLCKLMNAINPGSIPKININPTITFKMVENVDKFLKEATKFGVADHDLFQTSDLMEKRNIPAVINCLSAVGRACHLHPEYKGPTLGPKPAEANTREWTEDQINASRGMANLAS